MVQKKFNTYLTELLLECVSQPDPMLSMPAVRSADGSGNIRENPVRINRSTSLNVIVIAQDTVHAGLIPVWVQFI